MRGDADSSRDTPFHETGLSPQVVLARSGRVVARTKPPVCGDQDRQAVVSSDSDGLAVDPPGSAGIFRIARDSAGIDTALLQDGDCGLLKTPLATASASWGDPACRFPAVSMCAGA
jgi:hypothetical protein